MALAIARRRIKASGNVKKALALVPITKPLFPRYRELLEERYPHLLRKSPGGLIHVHSRDDVHSPHEYTWRRPCRHSTLSVRQQARRRYPGRMLFPPPRPTRSLA